MILYTIGFTRKTAEKFFELLQQNHVTVLVDTRLKPNSQLSGFARGVDLPYLLRQIVQCDYRHMPTMAPDEALLKQYRIDSDWSLYEAGFYGLLRRRNLIEQLDKTWWTQQQACLLCSEHEPDFCHRRLVAEYLASYWSELSIKHLL
jgi:uncharacterized protein (DUF488 family)